MLQYLLGALPQQWQARFEEQLFTEQRCLEHLRVVEDKLVDDYVSHTLSVPDRERFEKYYLVSDRRRRKVELAQALKKSLADLTPTAELQPQPQAPSQSAWQHWRARWADLTAPAQTRWRMAIFVGGVFLLGGGLFLLSVFFRTARPVPDDRQARIQPPGLTPVPFAIPTPPTTATPVASKPALSPTASPPARFLTIELEPGGLRGGSHAQPKISRAAQPPPTIRLKLLLRQPSDYTVWRVIVTSDGKEICQLNGTRAKEGQQFFVEATLPTRKLSSGDYLISLQGKTAAGKFAEVEDYTLQLTDQ